MSGFESYIVGRALKSGSSAEQRANRVRGQWNTQGIRPPSDFTNPFDYADQYNGYFDEQGYAPTLPGKYVDQDVQYASERYIAARNQALLEQAIGQGNELYGSARGALNQGINTLSAYRPGGAAALTSGMYGGLANAYGQQAGFGLQGAMARQLEAPDMMQASRDAAIKGANERAERAGLMQLGGQIIGAVAGAATGGAGAVAGGALGGYLAGGGGGGTSLGTGIGQSVGGLTGGNVGSMMGQPLGGQIASTSPGFSIPPAMAAGRGVAAGALQAASGGGGGGAAPGGGGAGPETGGGGGRGGAQPQGGGAGGGVGGAAGAAAGGAMGGGLPGGGALASIAGIATPQPYGPATQHLSLQSGVPEEVVRSWVRSVGENRYGDSPARIANDRIRAVMARDPVYMPYEYGPPADSGYREVPTGWGAPEQGPPMPIRREDIYALAPR